MRADAMPHRARMPALSSATPVCAGRQAAVRRRDIAIDAVAASMLRAMTHANALLRCFIHLALAMMPPADA
jgi:hypothetical protein